MFAVLSVPDEVVIGFFSAVVLGQTAAILALWRVLGQQGQRRCPQCGNPTEK